MSISMNNDVRQQQNKHIHKSAINKYNVVTVKCHGVILAMRCDFRPQDRRLAAHVVSTATNHHYCFVHLLCEVTGAQINGEQEAVWTEGGSHRLQFQRRGFFSLHVLRGNYYFLRSQAVVQLPVLEGHESLRSHLGFVFCNFCIDERVWLDSSPLNAVFSVTHEGVKGCVE